MKSIGYRRFVAVFVGILLAIGVVCAVLTGDESLIGMCLAVGVFYAIYMIQFVRKEKELKESNPKARKSPLIKR